MNITVQGAQELGEALRFYAAATGRKMEDVIARESREVGWALYDEFKRLSPSAGKLLRSAQARSWRMGRRGDKLAPARGGVSAASYRRAEGMLDGQKSDYFRVSINGEGVIQVRRVRFSGRKSRKFLRGGRFGNRFAKGSLRASQLTSEELQGSLSKSGRSDVRRLNITALAAAFELLNRQKAAKGGTLAVQWLPKVWQRRSSAMVKSGPLVVNSPTGYELGRVDFEKGPNGNLLSVTITGKAPGTRKQIESKGILPRVFQARIADRMAYARKKLAEAKAESF